MKFSLFALAVVSLSGAEAIQVKQQTEESAQVSAKAFETQLEALNTRMSEDQKELEKMKNLWGTIKGLF